MLQDFKSFLMKGNVVDMAVGFIFGAAFGTLIKSLVTNVVMPPVGQAMADVDFANMFYALDGNTYATLAELEEAGAPAIKYGTFINDAIGFIILGFVIFMLVRMITKMQKKEEAKPAAPAADIVLLTEIRDSLAKKTPTKKPAAKK
ncbi:large conductance mechanosensitive channel protein MscL [Candidatus Gracilibacteria bacterium]|nr:large conductance mechanosensitive channel protein MscL [Candidatus Gracilibacteria bacterium]